MFGPSHTHEQTPQYHANSGPVIACCFIIKGNLVPNRIHSTLCTDPTQMPLWTDHFVSLPDVKKSVYLLRGKALFGMTKRATPSSFSFQPLLDLSQ